ncbi:MAG TPA: hypothetical protein VGP64_11155 [Polyangia bacterium]|jgi:hypothetical protein
MAGKTFPGIGDLEDEAPPLDPADAADSASSPSYYSGPTVVDDVKVEQGLKKLRSLDAPPGPQTGIHRAVTDAMSEPARVTPQVPAEAAPLIPEITVDPSRGTAVGRSVSGPLPGQQSTQPFDDKHLRGTMFGHGVHLPDIEPPRRSEEVETSKALAVVERGKPTNHEIAIFQPGPYAHYRGTPATEAPYPPRTNRFHRTPIEVQPLPTRKKIVGRVLGAAACIGLIAGAALLWVRANTEDAGAYPKPATGVPAARPIDLHPLAPPPPAAPPETVSPPEATPPPEAFAPRPSGAPSAPVGPAKATPAKATPAKAAPAKAAPAKPAAARAAPTTASVRDEEAAAPGSRPGAAPPAPVHHGHGSRHHAASEVSGEGTKPDQGDKTAGKPEGAEPKPVKAKRPGPAEDDPDATMAPSIE